MDLISREALISVLDKNSIFQKVTNAEGKNTIEIINEQPTIDAVPVVHGKNLKAEWPSLFECSVCHWECWDSVPCDSEIFNFCPNCGAKMDGADMRKGGSNEII